MPIDFHAGNPFGVPITGPEKMYSAVMEYGLLPFFSGDIPGYSVEEMTPPSHWFTSESLGPWDWKIDCIRSGDIAYGKFIRGGKAAFATVECYGHLLNYRRSLDKYRPEGLQKKAYEGILSNGSMTSRELRLYCGLTKGKIDAVMAKLQMSTLVVTGDLQRVYKGEDLHYSGWQLTSYCTPEDLFEDDGFPFPGAARRRQLIPDCTPEESYATLRSHILSLFPDASDKSIAKILG